MEGSGHVSCGLEVLASRINCRKERPYQTDHVLQLVKMLYVYT